MLISSTHYLDQINISMPFRGGEARSDSLEKYGKSAKRQIVLFFLSKHKGGKAAG